MTTGGGAGGPQAATAKTDRCPDARQDCSTHGDAPIVSVVVTCAGPPRLRRTSPPGWHATAADPPDRHATMARCGLLTTECRDPTAAGERRPPHPLGPRVVPAVPDLPAAARRPARRAARRSSRPTRRYAHFLLDGQMAVVDDYLEVRPEARGRAAPRSPRTGRLAMGPWYILPDEFLVSGETLVRNLQLGLERGRPAFGGAMDVGYLPDMFGHVAQMPQLLAPVRLRPRRRVAGRARRRRPHRRSGGRRPTARPCGPSTCRPATATAPACPTTPRRFVAPHRRVRSTSSATTCSATARSSG